VGAEAGIKVRDRQDARRVQLGAGARGLDRLGAQLDPSLDQHASRGERLRSTATEEAWLRPSNDKAPKLQFEPTPYGSATRRCAKPIKDPETQQYVRTTLFIAPFTVLIPPNNQYKLAQMLVPMDDVNTMFYWVAWHPDPKKGITQESWRRFCAATVGEDLNPDFTKKRTLLNMYMQDRAAMKSGDFILHQGS